MNIDKIDKEKIEEITVYIFAAFTVVLMIVRLGDGTFWGDECHAIVAARNSFKQIIIDQSWDAHPPLYFLILSAFCKVFGFTPIVYRFVSVLPMIIAVCFGTITFRKEFGNKPAIIFIYLSTFMKGCLVYCVEVRMYSWSYLFILLMAYFAYRYCTGDDKYQNKYQALMIAFALCAAYTNMFAFLSACGVYLATFIWMGINKTFNLKKVLFIVFLSLILYSPWIWVNYRLYTQTVTGTPWVDRDYNFIESIRYAFNGVGGYLLIFILVLGIIISIAEKEYFIILNCVPFVFLYIFCFVYSKMTAPFIVGRYILPSFGPLYMAAAVSISVIIKKVDSLLQNKKKMFIEVSYVLVFICLLGLGVRNYVIEVSAEKKNTEETNRIAELINSSQDDMTIITDVSHLGWKIADVYFPGRTVEFTQCPSEYEFKCKNAWLIFNEPIDEEFVLKNSNSECEFIWEGFFTDRYCYIYRCSE